jgi:Ca2+-binding RTX toxin-like protein
VIYDHTNLVGHVRLFDPETETVGDLEAIDRTGSGGVSEMSVAALADGGFAVVFGTGDTPTTKSLQAKVYNADGSVRTAEFTIVASDAEYVQAHGTQSGFLVTGLEAEDGYARFFDADGTDLGAAFEAADGPLEPSAMDAALLPGGQVVITAQRDDGTAQFTIFDPDGTPTEATGSIAAGLAPLQSIRVAALDGGGFVTLHLDPDAALRLTVFDAQGAPVGQPAVLDFDDLLSPVSPGNVSEAFEQVRDIETTPDGQIVLAFVTHGATDGLDVRYALVGRDGTVETTGIATENIPDDQSQVHLTRLDGDRVLLSFTDDTNIQFGPQSSINGVVIQGGTIPDAPQTLQGDATDEELVGGDADDTISGGGGNDTIRGGDGADLIRGNIGEDTLLGEAGDDLLRGQKNGDLLEGGDGNDNMKGGGGNDTLIGGEGRDFLNGGARRDHLDAGVGNDRLVGRSFDDTLIGGNGKDFLNAGGADDRLEGGARNDRLKGGDGADVFVFDLGMDVDRIVDFDIAEGDRLEISTALADGRSEAEIAALAQVDGSGFELDFGGGDRLRLLDLGDVTGLEAQIDIV